MTSRKTAANETMADLDANNYGDIVSMYIRLTQ